MENTNYPRPGGIPDSVGRVAPALERYTSEILTGQVWQRPQLPMRDRSIVTISVLIARNQSEHLPSHVETALDLGVTPAALSALITHLAFYSGWANAIAATKVVEPVFERRGIDRSQLAPSGAQVLAQDPLAEERRHATVMRRFGAVAPGLVELTTDVLFRDLWLRPELSMRGRCLATIASVIATAQTAQLAFYLNRALDHGISRAELSEVMIQVAFYAGWSSAYTALAVLKDVFEGRPD
ncbi:4-carboxymuconolactone decarboxylase [Massilia sp. KIM]|uniref:carboxymuconolactone decarboxylase family protein n=1 Tax=Massilia sp. KIM TaxID=1955422 RepID=UPI00098E8AAB|nr:carboxymuconolactone decarboxylase family protein [Massilia sp. KIM]OON62367.1 4-carboxymuconolactone decarboxylase [Massilia sp. KIM]